jgi:hypothetical protein
MQYNEKQKQHWSFFQETGDTDGNDGATSTTDANESTTGTEGIKLKKQRRETHQNKIGNTTDVVLEVSLFIRPQLQRVMSVNTDVFLEIPFRSTRRTLGRMHNYVPALSRSCTNGTHYHTLTTTRISPKIW